MATAEWTVGSVLSWTTGYFEKAGLASPRVDAEYLIATALGVQRVSLYFELEKPLAPDELAGIRELVKRRAGREPLQHITGRVGFRYLELNCGPEALIPRQDTECLVDAVIDLAAGIERPLVLDVGTGTGAIALSLARELPAARVLACDISEEALELAERNRSECELAVELFRSDGFAALPAELAGSFDIIVSNPPYIAEALLAGLEPEVRDYDPRLALSPGPTGDEMLLRLLGEAARWLKPGGYLVLEVGDSEQADRIADAAPPAIKFLTLRQDLGGADRALVFRHQS